jgi:hypothetical protein
MAKLIFNNGYVTIGIGQVQNQLTPSVSSPGSATAAVTTCNVKSLSIEDKVNMIDLAGLCSVSEEQFITRTSGSVSIEVFVNPAAFTSYVFIGNIGKYCTITYDPDTAPGGVASGLAAIVRTGVIESVSTGAEVDGVITEKATIRIGTA